MEYLYVSIPRTTFIMTRYKFIKNIYKDYIVLITKKNKIITYNKDKELLDYLNVRELKELKKYNINYIIFDKNNEIFYKYKSINNNYNYYLMKYIIINFIKINYKEYRRRDTSET